jgi:hypothetical protein
MTQVALALILQIAVVGGLYFWMFRKDKRRRQHGHDDERRRSGILDS